MTALKQAAQQALEALDSDDPSIQLRAAITLRTALEQPVQEPVSCRFCHDARGCWTWQCYNCGEIDDVQQPAPPAAQRPWQGLTKVQRDDFSDKYGSYEAVCAIEQTLKERNT